VNQNWTSYAIPTLSVGLKINAFARPSQSVVLSDSYKSNGVAARSTNANHWGGAGGWENHYPIHMGTSQNVVFLDVHVQTVNASPRLYMPILHIMSHVEE